MIRVAITHGDINGTGYELIFKAFDDPTMLEMCTPIIYGSPKIASYHRKVMDLQTPYTIINNIEDVQEGKLNLMTCFDEEVKVEFGNATPEAGASALKALDMALEDYQNGMFDVLVTLPVNKHLIENFPGQLTYIEQKTGEGNKPLLILLNDRLKVACVTDNLPLRDVVNNISQEVVEEKIKALSNSLKQDFTVNNPRVAVLSLNPNMKDDGEMGKEEAEIISPAIENMVKEHIQCFGPYPADEFFGTGLYTHFDAVLAMYYDQGLAPFKAIATDECVEYTAGLPIVRTAPSHGVEYDLAGKGIANEQSLRMAIYTAMDICRNRVRDEHAHAHPLKKQYFEKRDDSDKLKLQQTE